MGEVIYQTNFQYIQGLLGDGIPTGFEIMTTQMPTRDFLDAWIVKNVDILSREIYLSMTHDIPHWPNDINEAFGKYFYQGCFINIKKRKVYNDEDMQSMREAKIY